MRIRVIEPGVLSRDKKISFFCWVGRKMPMLLFDVCGA